MIPRCLCGADGQITGYRDDPENPETWECTVCADGGMPDALGRRFLWRGTDNPPGPVDPSEPCDGDGYTPPRPPRG